MLQFFFSSLLFGKNPISFKKILKVVEFMSELSLLQDYKGFLTFF